MDISTCKICKKSFSYYSSASEGIYCSYSCYWKDKQGTSFAVPFVKGHKPWNKGIKIDKKKFPSMGHNKPHSKATKDKIRITKKNEPKGDKHWNWKGGKNAMLNRTRYGGNKYNVLERDNYTCQKCGSKDDLIIHHKDEMNHLSKNPNHSMDNLVVWCRSCHTRHHRKK